MKVRGLPIWCIKGATAWELQIGRIWFRWVHLKGGGWNTPVWCFNQRLTVEWIGGDYR